MKSKFKLILIFILFPFITIYQKIETLNVYEFPFHFKTKLNYFLWENFYKDSYQKIIEEISTKITNQLDRNIKIAQLIHIGISPKASLEEIDYLLNTTPIGGIILFKANIQSKVQLLTLIKSLQEISYKASNLPLFFSIDQEGGRVERINFISEFPGAMAVGQTNHAQFAWLIGFMTGYETAELGIHLVFAPVADINNNPDNPIINTRSFGSSKELVAKMIVNYIKGSSLTNSICFLKHFPGHGDTYIDSHLNLPAIDKTEEELINFELFPFSEGINHEAMGIMVGHILFPKIDSLPSSLSKKIISHLLKEKLNFKGMVITDAMEMKAITNTYPIEDAALMSFLGGADTLLLTEQNKNIIKIYDKLKKALDENLITEERINNSVKKQIQYKLYSGLFQEESLRNFKINESSINKYKKLLSIKKSLSDSIYLEIKAKYPDLEDKIAYEAIRSLHKDFPKLPDKNLYFFVDDPIFRETINNLSNSKSIFLFNKNQFPNSLSQNDIIIYEVASVEEWNSIAKSQLSYGLLIGIYTKNPFQRILLKENQYLIVSFSPTRKSKENLIKKVVQDSIPKANLSLPELVE